MENYPRPVTREEHRKISEYFDDLIYEIKGDKEKKGKGIFCSMKIHNKKIYTLITSYNIINEEFRTPKFNHTVQKHFTFFDSVPDDINQKYDNNQIKEYFILSASQLKSNTSKSNSESSNTDNDGKPPFDILSYLNYSDLNRSDLFNSNSVDDDDENL